MRQERGQKTKDRAKHTVEYLCEYLSQRFVYFSPLCIGQERPYNDDSMEVYSLDKKISAAAVAEKEVDRSVRFGHCKTLNCTSRNSPIDKCLASPLCPLIFRWAPFCNQIRMDKGGTTGSDRNRLG
jgi:hypothetical protein